VTVFPDSIQLRDVRRENNSRIASIDADDELIGVVAKDADEATLVGLAVEYFDNALGRPGIVIRRAFDFHIGFHRVFSLAKWVRTIAHNA